MQKNIFDTVHSHFPSFKDGIKIKKKTLRKPYKTIVVRCWFSCSKKYHFIILDGELVWSTAWSLNLSKIELTPADLCQDLDRTRDMIADLCPIIYVQPKNPTLNISYTFVCLHLDTTWTYVQQSIKKNGKTNRSQYKIC